MCVEQVSNPSQDFGGAGYTAPAAAAAPQAAAKVETQQTKNQISEDAFGNDNPFGSNASSEVERERGEG